MSLDVVVDHMAESTVVADRRIGAVLVLVRALLHHKTDRGIGTVAVSEGVVAVHIEAGMD